MKKELLIFVSIIFVSILFELVGWFDNIRAFAEKVTIPTAAYSTRVATQLSAPYDLLVFTITKSEYLRQLEAQHAQALTKLNEIDMLRLENQELRKLLGTSDRKLRQDTIIGAPIVSLAFPAVGVGSNDGVEENDMVLVDQVLVGTIETVTQYQSRVSLLSSKRENRILARTESGVEGVIDGDGRTVLLTHVPRSVSVQQGERVVTVGQEGIEKNVLIGIVQGTQQSVSDATQTVVISQLVSFYDAVLVEVQ